ncbi:aspartate kinase [Peijinzhouia sedimentorum]
MIVFKFGGASVKDAEGIQNLAKILKLYSDKKIVCIVSAMGKTTNALEQILAKVWANENPFEFIEHLKNYHLQTAMELELDIDAIIELNEIFDLLNEQLNTVDRNGSFDFYYDQIVSFGELLSTTIVHHFLVESQCENWLVPAKDLIRTNNLYRDAEVNWELTQANLQKLIQGNPANIILTQGFIGGDENGNCTTLGREGSDFTAAIIAHCINAESVSIWKDVPGVLTADPRIMKETQKFERISYQDAAEMTYYGAVVIHPKTILPLSQKGIPLHVKPFLQPEASGTVISQNKGQALPTYIYKFNQTLISFATRDFSFIHEKNLSDILQELSNCHIHANLMQNSATSFSVIFDYRKDKFEQLIQALQEHFSIKYNHELTLLTIKNYLEENVALVKENKEFLIEQKTRNTFQLLYK